MLDAEHPPNGAYLSAKTAGYATAGKAATPINVEARTAWRLERLRMERGDRRHGPGRSRRKPRWDPFDGAVAVAKYGLRLIGLYQRGVRNALATWLDRCLTRPAVPK